MIQPGWQNKRHSWLTCRVLTLCETLLVWCIILTKIIFFMFIVIFTAYLLSLLLLNLEQKAIHVKVNNDRKAMEGTQSQRASQRTKRKCCTAVSYIEPGLRRYINTVTLFPVPWNVLPFNQSRFTFMLSTWTNPQVNWSLNSLWDGWSILRRAWKQHFLIFNQQFFPKVALWFPYASFKKFQGFLRILSKSVKIL